MLAVISAALVYFSLVLVGRVPASGQRGLGLVLSGALLLAMVLPMVLYGLILRASEGGRRRWQLLDAGLVVAGWITLWVVFVTAR